MLHVRLLGELQAEVDGGPSPAAREPPRLGAAGVAGAASRASTRAARSPRASGPTCSTPAPARRCAARCGRCGARSGDDDALVAGRDRIGLRCETDLAAFDALCAAGRLEEAVALHRGPLLADLDEDWVLEARDEHAERLGAALARLAAAAATPAEAVGWARRRLALDPLDEDAARDLMRRLAAAGDRAGALAVYDRLADRLRDDARPGAVGRRRARSPRSCARRGRGAERARRARAAAGAADGPPLVGRDARARPRCSRSWERVRAGAAARSRCSAARAGSARRGSRPSCSRAPARPTARARRAAPRVDLGGAPPFGLWAELLAGLARELEPPPADADWPEELGAARAVAAAPARAAARRARRRRRPSSPARGCSRRPSSSPSTPPPTARSCCCSTTSTSPTRRRSSCSPTSRAGSSACPCCSSSRAA